MIIAGERSKAASGKTYEVRNPATGDVVDVVPAGGPADVDKAAQAAAKTFATWSKLAPAKRAEILHKAAHHMLGKVEEIAPILTKEQGKTLLESRLEAQRFGENIAWFADLADKVHGQHVSLPDTTTYGLVIRMPIGVCGAIVPWNFPLTLAANKVAPAIAAGNTVVLKPASTTPLSTLACIEALIEGGLPEGVVNVVLGTATGEAMVEHPLIRKIALTGSTPTGKKVMARAAEGLKKINARARRQRPLHRPRRCRPRGRGSRHLCGAVLQLRAGVPRGQASLRARGRLRGVAGEACRARCQAEAGQRPGQGQPDGADAQRGAES